MKRLLTLLVFAIPCLCQAQYIGSGYRELYESEKVSSMKESVGYFASAALEGRLAGSEGEKEAAQYLRERLLDCGIDVLSEESGEVFGMKQENGDTLVSRNVIAFIPGYDVKLRDKYIVIGARLDNMGSYYITVDGEKRERIFFGANGNASGLAMLVELAKMLSTNRVLLKRSVIIAGFGASLQSQAGSWYFLNRSFADVRGIDAMINLDMLGTPSRGFYAFTSSNRDMDSHVHNLAATLQPLQPKLVSIEPCASDHRSFYNSEIPSIMFTSGMYPEYNTDKDTPSILEYDEMERELEYLYNFAVDLCNGDKPSFRDKPAEDNAPVGTVAFHECDYRPTFLGSQDPENFLRRWVYTYLRYPRECVEQGIQGKVLVSFTIDEKGKVGDVRVLRGVHELLDAEAVRVVSASPDWKPGRQKGRKVKTSISMNIEFRLQKK